ncbi:MAG: FAD-dependent oxidoreductase [Bacteroidales bacterium]
MNEISRVERILIKNAPKVGTPTYTFSVEIDEKLCTGCAKCAIECPSRIIEMIERESTGIQKSACASECLADNGARDAIKAINDGGTYEDAWNIITKTNPIPAITGRICPHPCEDKCNRASLDEAVNVHGFERFVGDYALEHNLKFKKPANQNKGKVAVVGAGPAGVGAAYQLALLGYKVTVFEELDKAGGMLRYGIPEYRLPRDIIDKEIKRIEDLGIEFKYNVKLGKDIKLENLKKDYNAV